MNFVYAIYSGHMDRWYANGNINLQTLHVTDLAVKIARRLVCYGFPAPHRNDSCRRFFSLLTAQLPSIYSTFEAIYSPDGDALGKCGPVAKHLLHAGKFCEQFRYRCSLPTNGPVLELSSNAMENYAMNHSFVLMPNSIQLVEVYWKIATSASNTPVREIQKVVIQGLMLLKQCIKLATTPETHLKLMGAAEGGDMAESLRTLHTDLFSTSSLNVILEALITRFFVLTAEDVKAWESVCRHKLESRSLTSPGFGGMVDLARGCSLGIRNSPMCREGVS